MAPTDPLQLDPGGYNERSNEVSQKTPELRGVAPANSATVAGKLSDGELARALLYTTALFNREAQVEFGNFAI